MIAGNPKSGRRIATLAIVLVIAIVVILSLVGLRRRNAPLNHQPLHPATSISPLGSHSNFTAGEPLERPEFGASFHRVDKALAASERARFSAHVSGFALAGGPLRDWRSALQTPCPSVRLCECRQQHSRKNAANLLEPPALSPKPWLSLGVTIFHANVLGRSKKLCAASTGISG